MRVACARKRRPPDMDILGAILLLVFLSLIAGMALCAGCDREWFGIDQ